MTNKNILKKCSCLSDDSLSAHVHVCTKLIVNMKFSRELHLIFGPL